MAGGSSLLRMSRTEEYHRPMAHAASSCLGNASEISAAAARRRCGTLAAFPAALRPILRPYELLVGLRYTRAKRRNHFISFISIASMVGIALGVWALIVVLSVMNGFQQELRERILGVASHVQIQGFDGGLADWQQVAREALTNPAVVAAAPYVNQQGLIANGQSVQGALVRGIVPQDEERVADIGAHMKAGRLEDLQPGRFGIVLGSELAFAVGARLGDKIVLISPQGQVTPAGILPRIKQFTVVGIFEVGMYEYDAGLALIHLEDAQRLYRLGDARLGGAAQAARDVRRAAGGAGADPHA